MKEGVNIESLNLIYQAIVNVQDEIITEMTTQFPKSKVYQGIKELIFARPL